MSRRISAKITGVAGYVPPRVLSNADLSTFLDTSDEWITSRTGMKERRISHVTAGELSAVAAARALACAGLPADDLDLIIYGGVSNEAVGTSSQALEPAPNSAGVAESFHTSGACACAPTIAC